jgi:Tfp pilus assembly protein PilF
MDRAFPDEPLRGHRIAFTGRLASLTRKEAIGLVRSAGGEWSSSVTPRTTMLVVGQEGWPLRKDGRLSRKLLLARRLQRLRPVTILTESDLLGRLGLSHRADETHNVMSTAELGRALGVPGNRLRSWVEQGLVQPTKSVAGVHYFEFRQASWIQTLCRFAGAGITVARLRHSLRQLRRWLPEAGKAVQLLERDGRLLVRLGLDQLAEPDGQLNFDFSEPASEALSIPSSRRSADDWFEEGLAHEQAGELAEAVEAYRMALRQGGPDAATSFNLANVLNALGRKEQAVERLHQVIEMEPHRAEAWTNLGVILHDVGRREEALAALEQAVLLDPQDASAHYNLADALEDVNRGAEAIEHWKAYLRLDGTGPWGQYARKRLAARSG